MNLTSWCNLFSTASKYNIQVNKSHSKPFIIAVLFILFFLLLLVGFSYAYHLALAVAFSILLALSLCYSLRRKKQQKVLYQFEVEQQGLCVFSGGKKWQLQHTSRVSFLGCWLILIPLNVTNRLLLSEQKQIFIFRDSLSEQDFSRLSSVLKNLSANH